MKFAKITTKINHDSLWLKVKFDVAEVRVALNRYSVTSSITTNPGIDPLMKDQLRKLSKEMFDYMNKPAAGGTNGDKLKYLEKTLNERFVTI